MRVVLDTGVLVRAAKKTEKGKRGSPAREVLRLIRSGSHVLVLSDFLLTELNRVLYYPRVRRLHCLTEEEMRTYVAELDKIGQVEKVPAVVREDISTDPDDNPIIQTAIQGKADILCAVDRHIRHKRVQTYCAAHGVRVLTDLELLRLLRETEGRA